MGEYNIYAKPWEKLEAIEANLPCPRCGRDEFEVLRDVFLPAENLRARDFCIDRVSSLNVVPVMCSYCGYLALHVVRRLDATYKEMFKDGDKDTSNK